MRKIHMVSALIAAFVLSGCGKPVPVEKSAYVGEWQSSQMAVLITQDGSLRYKRLEGGVTKSIEAPLKGFDGDNFIAGIGPMETTFVVSSKPHLDGNVWKMTVDGVELQRAP